VQSPSSLAGKSLKSREERFDRILRLANETSLADPRVCDTSPSETPLTSQCFPTLADTAARENRNPGMDIHGPVHKSPQAYQRWPSRRHGRVDLEEGGVPQLERINRLDAVAVARNP